VGSRLRGSGGAPPRAAFSLTAADVSERMQAQDGPCGLASQGSSSGLEAQGSPLRPPSASTATKAPRPRQHPPPCSLTVSAHASRDRPETEKGTDVVTDSHSMHADPHNTV